ncbi:hypothetical protein Lbys_0386 [Leadbetterella byssophila DSM 17132]|uniref:Uncharacterized protein n=1 Tax=Leadbetterella byssophila (strain DSM 17132 / JCM 16389 / KACC 11308 / NBRC 106382 / 4M15) TaxID=649349 RepID=E4RW21_LEAB4|nr:hypothetical protein [Leadbetterella byssophila]ADQ16164.1 hypothetical protein Lbys_0386 [Leadbetterella byssophila DSM 17132]
MITAPTPIATTINGPTQLWKNEATVLAATPAVAYLWNHGANTQSITIIAATTYIYIDLCKRLYINGESDTIYNFPPVKQ